MKKPPKPQPLHMRGELKKIIRREPVVFAVYLVLRLIVIASLVLAILRREYESAFVCVLVLVLFMLPFFIQKNFGIRLPGVLEIIILLFIFAAEILGELQSYFIQYPNWDTMLHTTNGFLCAAVGFSLIDILNRNAKIKFTLSPVYVALAAFCFSMTIGVLWEFFEFGMDRLFHMDMQKDTIVHTISSVMLDPTNSNIPITIDGITSVAVNGQDLGFSGYLDIGLYDTMEDLFVNFIGATVFSVIGYFYLKRRGGGRFAAAFIPTLEETEKEADADYGNSPAQTSDPDVSLDVSACLVSSDLDCLPDAVLARGASDCRQVLGVLSSHRRSNSVLPVLYHSLLHLAPAAVSDDGLSVFHRCARIQAFRGLHRTRLRRLDPLLHALSERAGPASDGICAERFLHLAGQDGLRRRHQHQRASEHARHRLRGIDARVLRCTPAACKKAASGDADAGRADQRLNGFCQAALDARCARCHSGERCFVPDRLSSVPQKPAQTECITPRPFPDRGDGRFLLPKCCFFGKAVI